MKRLLLGFVGSFVVFAQGAYAHTELSQSMPADKAVLQTAPKDVMLHFNEPVRLTMLSVQKRGDAKQDLGPLPQQPAKDFALAAPGLGDGRYVVTWRAMSEDTHALRGEFAFTVGAEGDGREQSTRPAQSQHSDHSGHH